MTQNEAARQNLAAAEKAEQQALTKLHSFRRTAMGGTYNQADYNNAVLEWRAAQDNARRALEVWNRISGSQTTANPTTPPATTDIPDGFRPTPPMLFAKWLYKTGRLSDWMLKVPQEAPVD